MTLNADITAMQTLLIAVSVVCSVIALLVFFVKTQPVVRCRKVCDRRADDPAEARECPGVSVIVYSVDEPDRLQELLPMLLDQEYDGEYEVIVVNEGDSLRVRDVIEAMNTVHHNLYLTHTPDGARNLSRKKLALTLGIKAARYPVIAVTTADATIPSRRWLALMTEPMGTDSRREVVLGYSTAPADDDNAPGARMRAFDNLADSTMWLSDALYGHPWRGTGQNLVYRRDLFFRSKGFSSHLNLRHGDDDIFVSRIATADNCAVQLAGESIVTVAGDNCPSAARLRQRRRRFTRRFISRRPRIVAQLGWWSYLTALAAAVAAAALPPYSTGAFIGAGIALTVWLPVSLVWRRAARALDSRMLLLTLPWLAATRPLRAIIQACMARLRHGKRYTWE